MRGLVSVLARTIQAAMAALTTTWKLTLEAGKLVWKLVPRPHREPLPPLPAVEEPAAAEDVAAGLKRWCEARLKGDIIRLPRGVSPAEAEWATRLLAKDLEKVARSSPAAIGAHLRGGASVDGLRPMLAVIKGNGEAAAVKRDSDREALKRDMRAALARSAAADRKRRDTWIERDGVDPFGEVQIRKMGL